MLDSLFAYLDGHAWAQWAFGALVVVPPVLISWSAGERGFGAIGAIVGWWAFLIILALILL